MIKKIINPRIRGFDSYVKDVEGITSKEKAKGLIEIAEMLFTDHIMDTLGQRLPHRGEEIFIPTEKIILSGSAANDAKRHHFYFAFIWEDETQQIIIYYLKHESISEEYDEKKSIRFLGFEELKKDYQTTFISSNYQREVNDFKEFSKGILETLEVGEIFTCRMYAESEDSIDGKPRTLHFEIERKDANCGEVFYRGAFEA